MTEVRMAKAFDAKYADQLVDWYRESAKQRGTGIANRSAEYLKKKMEKEDAIIAFDENGDLAGFVYIETFDDQKFVVNSGLIIRPDIRSGGLGKKVKLAVFDLTRSKYPNSKVFSITTSLAVMRMNTELGYRPVTFSELTTSDDFWNGCKSCKNFEILTENQRKMCLCTGLVYDKLDKNLEAKNPTLNLEDGKQQR
ncbi:MAG: GNAT family N-acetyltransferase [Flavobacteriaceae bacterium]|nr:MAG: GNAT family N-acetyltransferase [Flavobacteriaceae bacterium]